MPKNYYNKVMITQYDFFKTKYGKELLIDLILLEDLKKYIESTPVQRLSYFDITIITKGEGTFIIDDHEHELTHGSIFFSSPGQIRKWNTTTTPEGYVLIFEDEFLCTFFNDTQFVQHLSYFNPFNNPSFLKLVPDDFQKLLGLLQDIKNEISTFKSNDIHILRALLYQALIFLNRKFIAVHPTSHNIQNRYISQFIQLVETSHIQNRNVDYYAQMLFITSGHLNSLVKDHLGVTAKKYIMNKTILEAKRLLQYTDLSIDQIADSLNYENTNYFIRTFKEYTHTTPLNFRKHTNP